jgi:hypothetical protein
MVCGGCGCRGDDGEQAWSVLIQMHLIQLQCRGLLSKQTNKAAQRMQLGRFTTLHCREQ